MQWVWSCKCCKPFPEAVSLQNIEHSSKHGVFLSEKVQFFFRKWFSLRSITQLLSKHQIPTQYAVCDKQWVVLWKCALVGAHYSIPWNRKIVVKGKCCLQVEICLEGKIIPWIRKTILGKTNINVERWNTSFYGAQPFSRFPCMTILPGKTQLLQHNCPEDEVFP